MFRRVWRHGFVAVAAIAMLAIAQPTLAFKLTDTTGVIGRYVIYDTYDVPGAQCIYDPGPGILNTLVRLEVFAPDMWARRGMGTEKVGWSATIQRKIQGGRWTNRVTTRTFTAYTDGQYPAQFPVERAGARVIVPNGVDGPSASYRGVINLFWYAANGRSVIGTVTGRIQYFLARMDDGPTRYGVSCFDYEL